MAITFKRFKQYLDAIDAAGDLHASDSGHGVWWNIDYAPFKSGTIPSKKCNAQPVPIFNSANPKQSAFYLILQGGWCQNPSMPQMPKTGPFITDSGYSVTLSDGTVITGTQIIQDIGDWLAAGAPELG